MSVRLRLRRRKPRRPFDLYPGRCQHMTLKGERCRLPGDPYCLIHKPKETAP